MSPIGGVGPEGRSSLPRVHSERRILNCACYEFACQVRWENTESKARLIAELKVRRDVGKQWEREAVDRQGPSELRGRRQHRMPSARTGLAVDNREGRGEIRFGRFGSRGVSGVHLHPPSRLVKG